MNPGILGMASQEALGPYPLLGSPRPIPTIDARAYDADAGRYIDAVERADGQRLEPAVASAINSFVVGCKATNVWAAIRASCILCGARTLSGALTPLAGSTPTNNNFVSADYNRRTGLVGNGTNKWLTANRAGNADGQADVHASVWIDTVTTSTGAYIGQGDGFEAGGSNIMRFGSQFLYLAMRSGNGGASQFLIAVPPSAFTIPGFVGASRDNLNAITYRVGGSSFAGSSITAFTPNANSWEVFGRGAGSRIPINGRLRWYSIGPAVNVAVLGQLVDTLMADLQAAIP